MDGIHERLIIVDCSTANPEATERLAKKVERQGAILVDAPLARTPREAKDGRLNVMVGGDVSTVSAIKPTHLP